MANCVPEIHCVKAPIDEECVAFCLERILRTATAEEERLILGYTDGTANAVFRAYQTRSITGFNDLARWLAPDQVQEILHRFREITQFQLDYFRLNRNDRENIINSIRNLGFDLNREGDSLPA